ncbi:MAG: T9SS type A sorting domain-containing protein [Flavobacteriales bacterium]|nr:T9SS type A sorting domain-containing protein [Flavobacteriales bacterium]
MIKPPLLLFLFAPCFAYGQMTIGSAGGELNSSTNRIEYNIGEPVVGTLVSGSNTLTQGFEQPWADIEVGISTAAPEAAINVYPNPTRQDLNIQLPSNAHHNYTVYDAAGKLILYGNLNNSLTTLDVANLKSGNYNLIVDDTIDLSRQTFRIIITL